MTASRKTCTTQQPDPSPRIIDHKVSTAVAGEFLRNDTTQPNVFKRSNKPDNPTPSSRLRDQPVGVARKIVLAESTVDVDFRFRRPRARLCGWLGVQGRADFGHLRRIPQTGLITCLVRGVIICMVTSTPSNVITAKAAAEMALITYRQLDHWARQGWVTPSVQTASGRGKRRQYSADDVLRLAALRHFAKSGWPVADLGDQIATVDIAGARWVLVGSKTGLIAVADNDALQQVVSAEGQFSAYDLKPLRSRLRNPDSGHGGHVDARDTHTNVTSLRKRLA